MVSYDDHSCEFLELCLEFHQQSFIALRASIEGAFRLLKQLRPSLPTSLRHHRPLELL